MIVVLVHRHETHADKGDQFILDHHPVMGYTNLAIESIVENWNQGTVIPIGFPLARE